MPTSTFFNLPKEKRGRVLDAAIDEFADNTYDQASIANIIRQAQIPRGSFYQYFIDKKDLYIYLLELIGDGKRRKLMPLLNNEKAGDFFQTLKALFQAGAEYLAEYPKLTRIAELFMIYPNQDIMQEFMGKNNVEALNFYKELLKEGVANGELNSEIDIDLVADLLMAISHVISERYVKENKFPSNIAATEDFAQMLDFIKNGIAKK